MNKISFPFVPFDDGKTTLHLVADETYLGCICLNGEFSDSAAWAKLCEDNRLYCFSDAEDAAERRLPGERLLVLSNGPRRAPASENDCYAALGGYGTGADIAVSACGRSGAALLLCSLRAARRRRLRSFLAVFAPKLVLLLLSVFGILPILLCVPIELLFAALSYRLALISGGSAAKTVLPDLNDQRS